jgi:hypothetical protein
MRRPFKQTSTLNQRLSQHAERLHREALGTPPGFARDKLTRLARQAETASHIEEWLSSPGLKAPL